LGVAGILAGIGTAIASANGAFAGHPHLHYWFYGAAALLVLVAIIGGISGMTKGGHPAPRIVATRYGQSSTGTALHSHGYPVGRSGLILVNDGEPAYEIGVYPGKVSLGAYKLCFENTIRRLTKNDGEAQLSTWIERSKSEGILGNDLFHFMRENNIVNVTIPIRYKDSSEKWYRSVCHIERDVVHSRDGLVITSSYRGRAWKPKTHTA